MIAGERSRAGSRQAPVVDMLELASVTKRFGPTVAVDSISLRIAPEKTTVLIGPSGCGKSTVLRLMLGLITPDEGKVTVADEPLTPDNARSVRQRMGYVVQTGGLFPHLTARENLSLLPEHLGRSSGFVTDRIAELAELTHFPPDGLDRFPAQLSGGQRQRVGLMRALMLDPDVLLMDEPLGALDPMIRNRLQEELRQIFRTLNKTVVVVTHDLREAAYFGDSIVLMRRGRIVQQGTFASLSKQPREPFVTEFVDAQRGPEALSAEESR